MAFPGPHKVVQFPRGNSATVDAYTGPIAQIVVDTEKNELRVMDGVTAGGWRIPNMTAILAEVPSGGGGGGGALPEGSVALALAAIDTTQRSWPATSWSNYAPKANPTLTGTVSVPTATTNDRSTKAASTEFVRNFLQSIEGSNALASAGIDTVQRLWPATAFSQYVAAASPAFSGTPTAPTPSTADNSTRIATTAQVQAAIAAYARPAAQNTVNLSETNFPLGTTVLVDNSGQGGQSVTTTGSAVLRLHSSNPSKGYQMGGTGAILAGTWRCRGNIDPTGNGALWSMFERTA